VTACLVGYVTMTFNKQSNGRRIVACNHAPKSDKFRSRGQQHTVTPSSELQKKCDDAVGNYTELYFTKLVYRNRKRKDKKNLTK